jgi:hypothetical protein
VPAGILVLVGKVDILIFSIFEGEEDGVAVVVALDENGGILIVTGNLDEVAREDIWFEDTVKDGDLLIGPGIEDDGGGGVGAGVAFGGVGGEEVGVVFFAKSIANETGHAQDIQARASIPAASGQPGFFEALAGLAGGEGFFGVGRVFLVEVIEFIGTDLALIPGLVAVGACMPGEENGGVAVAALDGATPEALEFGRLVLFIGSGEEDETTTAIDGGLDGVHELL